MSKPYYLAEGLVMNTLCYLGFGVVCPVSSLIARIAAILIFIALGFPKMMSFDDTAQYMASLGVPMSMLVATIVVVMEVLTVVLIVPGLLTRPLAVLFIFCTLGTMTTGHHY